MSLSSSRGAVGIRVVSVRTCRSSTNVKLPRHSTRLSSICTYVSRVEKSYRARYYDTMLLAVKSNTPSPYASAAGLLSSPAPCSSVLQVQRVCSTRHGGNAVALLRSNGGLSFQIMRAPPRHASPFASSQPLVLSLSSSDFASLSSSCS